ncbi:MAG: nucleoside triphosphate pyrophosphohydrolase [Treponema sp.]
MKPDSLPEFSTLYGIIKRLRAPNGCPWDIAQTPLTLRSTLIEETYEAIDAIDETSADAAHAQHAAEELGDVLLNVLMIAYMFEQAGAFSVRDMLNQLNEKLIRRHPHVFGQTEGFANPSDSARPQTAENVLIQWEQIKETVEGRAAESVLDSIPKTFPPILRAYKLQKKAAKKGFDWNTVEDAYQKVDEELKEFHESLNQKNACDSEQEFGDLLFSLINVARHLHIDPTIALNHTNAKFEKRFRFVERKMGEAGLPCTHETLPHMDKFWEQAKQED